jgi:hypothetical protein
VVADEVRAAGFAPIAIGLGLTLIHLISIPVSNTYFNGRNGYSPIVGLLGCADSGCCSGCRPVSLSRIRCSRRISLSIPRST